MRLQGGVSLSKSGLGMSISAMHLGMEIMGIGSENITGSDKGGCIIFCAAAWNSRTFNGS